MNQIIKNSFLLLFFCTAVVSCKKLDLAPRDRFSELTFWQEIENVNLSLNTCYSGIYNSTLVFYNDGLSDNAYARLAGATGVDAIASGNFTPQLPRLESEWGWYYRGIKSCNLFLENVDKNTSLSEAAKNRMKAEVRFIRAWHHFNLMKWWGDVPLLSKDITDPAQAKTVSRTPRAEVLKFVTDELDAVTAVLPKKEDYAVTDRGRITKAAAIALKARVLLYEGNRMTEVVALCEQLINNQAQNGVYALATRYSDLFSVATENKNSNEPVFSLQYVPPARVWGDYIDFAPISTGARTSGMSPTQELVDSYIMLNGKPISDPTSGFDEANQYNNRDPRLTATVVYHQFVWQNAGGGSQTIYIQPGSTPSGQSTANEYNTAGQGSATGYYWRKYFDIAPVQLMVSGLNIHLIRYADVLLMYAEAKQSLGQLDAATWDKTIKPIRQRAGFTLAGALDFPTGATAAQLQQIVRNERRAELAFEGLRIDDIRRWRIAQTVLTGWAHGARYGDPSIDRGYLRAQLRNFNVNRHYLWPLPASELANNTNLTQNPNY
jgi:starch-binding outer membrane protein, SusD/RagB family